MTVERRRVELRQHEDPAQVGVQAVADRHVDEPILAADRHRGLGAELGEGVEPAALAAAQDEREHVAHGSSISRALSPIYQKPTTFHHANPIVSQTAMLATET